MKEEERCVREERIKHRKWHKKAKGSSISLKCQEPLCKIPRGKKERLDRREGIAERDEREEALSEVFIKVEGMLD